MMMVHREGAELLHADRHGGDASNRFLQPVVVKMPRKVLTVFVPAECPELIVSLEYKSCYGQTLCI